MIYRSISTTSCATGVLILALNLSLAAQQQQPPAQRGGPPRAETPQLIVSTLASPDRRVGIAAAEAIRKRMQSEHNATDIYLTPGKTIDATLVSSGYPVDSALGQSDLLLLARQVRGDWALSGSIEKTAAGMQTSIRLVSQRGQQIIAEPLAPVLGADLGDIAKQVDRAVSEALRALSFHRECMNGLIAADYARAMTAAQQGLKIRPTSAAINQCVLGVLRATHASPDSIIAVANAITAVDSTSSAAWANLADAYTQKKDTAHALAATQMVHRLDPTNVDITSDLVDRLVLADHATDALVLLDTAMAATPGNAALLRKQWLIQLRLRKYPAVLATGAALIAADSAAATTDYFERQIAAAQTARDSVAVRRIALDASARFPKNPDFIAMLARDAITQGASRDALQYVERLLAIDSKNDRAWQLAIAAQLKANGPDSAIATGRRALAAGVAKDSIGPSLIALVGPALTAAQTSQKRADWAIALRMAQAVDSIAPTARGSYYIGVAAYQVASDEVQQLSTFAAKKTSTRAERTAACEASGRAEALLGTVTMSLPKGGSVDPSTAGRILGAVSGMSDFVTSVKQASCRPRDD